MTTLTLDIGGTKIAAALVTDDGKVGTRHTVPTPATEGAAAVVATAIAVGRRAAQGYAVARVGVSTAGVVDSATGTITHATDLIRGWSGSPLGPQLAAAFTVPVRCLNDVHAHALGEALRGAGRNASSMLLVAVGTGIGGAHVLDGRVVTGTHGAAGHLGHVDVAQAHAEELLCSCGRIGHLEAFASGSALAAATALDPAGAPARLQRAGLATGQVIGSLLNVLDPDLVVLSGGVSRAGVSWLEALREGVRSSAMDVVAATPVVLAEQGDEAAHLGAFEFARREESP